ncbi:MAG: hypothetical protein EPO21_15450 [Chloroflexota bacterium]|nr:MAG: hypothetical protein EPO21_15450 [Chloroflexota bacterium]
MCEMDYETITYESGRIARITLNRPDRLNAVNKTMIDEIVSAFKEAENDPEVRVIVLKGAGRCFSAGYDLGPGGYKVEPIVQEWKAMRDISLDHPATVMWKLMKPVIAQVHGYCTGFALDLVGGMCDITIAAEDAKIGQQEGRGFGTLALHLWPYLIGPQRSKMLMFTGEFISGKEAERIGLVLKATAPEQLDEEVNALAEKIASGPPELIAIHKAQINRFYEEMGLWGVIASFRDLDAIAHLSKVATELFELAQEKGAKAAVQRMMSGF